MALISTSTGILVIALVLILASNTAFGLNLLQNGLGGDDYGDDYGDGDDNGQDGGGTRWTCPDSAWVFTQYGMDKLP